MAFFLHSPPLVPAPASANEKKMLTAVVDTHRKLPYNHLPTIRALLARRDSFLLVGNRPCQPCNGNTCVLRMRCTFKDSLVRLQFQLTAPQVSPLAYVTCVGTVMKATQTIVPVFLASPGGIHKATPAVNLALKVWQP